MKIMNITNKGFSICVKNGVFSPLMSHQISKINLLKDDFAQLNVNLRYGIDYIFMEEDGDEIEINIVPEPLPEIITKPKETIVITSDVNKNIIVDDEVANIQDDEENEENLSNDVIPLEENTKDEWEAFLRKQTKRTLADFAKTKNIAMTSSLSRAERVQIVMNWLKENNYVKF